MALKKTTYKLGDRLSANKVNEIQDAIISAEKAIEELQKSGGSNIRSISMVATNVSEQYVVGQFEKEEQ